MVDRGTAGANNDSKERSAMDRPDPSKSPSICYSSLAVCAIPSNPLAILLIRILAVIIF